MNSPFADSDALQSSTAVSLANGMTWRTDRAAVQSESRNAQDGELHRQDIALLA
jgi:hypothetical protein